MNPKALKLIAKLAVMAVSSLLIGTIVKGEKEAQQRINDHFDPKSTQEN